ncbi:MAG: hypothetical protein AVDCRST_MAG66-2849, partial [uncultured Pseudonocardia sp.]
VHPAGVHPAGVHPAGVHPAGVRLGTLYCSCSAERRPAAQPWTGGRTRRGLAAAVGGAHGSRRGGCLCARPDPGAGRGVGGGGVPGTVRRSV